MTLFTCPIHCSNDHTLDRCGSVKSFFAVSPQTNSAPGGSTGRGGDSGTVTPMKDADEATSEATSAAHTMT
jgi:hypothetical protein